MVAIMEKMRRTNNRTSARAKIDKVKSSLRSGLAP